MVNLTAALAPVLCLLALLRVMDSFKLVSLRFVIVAILFALMSLSTLKLR